MHIFGPLKQPKHLEKYPLKHRERNLKSHRRPELELNDVQQIIVWGLFFCPSAFSEWTLQTLSTVQGHRGLLIVRPWGTLAMSEVSTVNKRGTEWHWRWNAETGKDAFWKNGHDAEIDVQSHGNEEGKEKPCCTKQAVTQISPPKAPAGSSGYHISLLSLPLCVRMV